MNRRRAAALSVLVVVLAGGGALVAWRARAKPPAPAPQAEQRYQDIKREDYEKWMQDLGYTE